MSELNLDSLFGMDNDEIDASSGEASFPNGIYLFELTSVRHLQLEQTPSPISAFTDGKHSIIFEWTICDEDSQYYGESFQQWQTIFPHMTEDIFAKLSGPDKKTYKDSRRFLSLTAKNIGAESLRLSALKDREGIKRYLEVNITHKDDGTRGYVKIKSVTDPDSIDQAKSSGGNGFSLV